MSKQAIAGDMTLRFRFYKEILQNKELLTKAMKLSMHQNDLKRHFFTACREFGRIA